MANQRINSTVILNETLRILTTEKNFIANIDRQYDKRFATQYGMAGKPGAQIQIRLPNQYEVREGLVVKDQGVQESSVTLSVATPIGVDISFDDVDLTLNENDFSKTFIQPAVSRLATRLEAICFGMYKEVFQQVGTAGTTPGDTGVDAFDTYMSAKEVLHKAGTPKDNKLITIVPGKHERFAVGAFKALFQDSSEISKQYLEGKMGMAMGSSWYSNDLCPTHTNGTQGGTPVVYGASQTGATLNSSGWTAGATITQGTIFYIGSGTKVYMVHPEEKSSYGQNQQFVVTANVTADSNGLASLPISPSIITSGAYQTVTASPDHGATITLSGSASTTYPLGMTFHPEAFTLATIDMDLPKSMEMAETKVANGISMSFIRGFDIRTRQKISRLDLLYAIKCTRPQLACRIIG
jgi:P22 coat protein - gene protein 5